MMRRPRGSGTIYRQGPTWSIRFGSASSRQYETGFRTKAEAERRLTLLRAEALHRRLGVAADPRLTPTLDALATPWLERRKETHAAGQEDGSRWRKHLSPWVGHLRPAEVDAARLREFVEAKRGEIDPATVRVVVSVLSSLYEDLLERGVATVNPCRHLPKSILRLMRSEHDPETVPFVEKLGDVQRIFLALDEPLSVAYAIGVFGGLRTGEVFALEWTAVDLGSRRMVVSRSVKGRTKGRRARVVPILDSLLPVLEQWKLKTGGKGLVIPPLRSDGGHVDKSTPANALRPVLAGLGMHALAEHPKPWYVATRHTFASQWAMAGRSLWELQKILGHRSMRETQRYAHLAPDYFAEGVHGALGVDLAPGGRVAKIGHSGATNSRAASATTRKNKRKTGAAL